MLVAVERDTSRAGQCDRAGTGDLVTEGGVVRTVEDEISTAAKVHAAGAERHERVVVADRQRAAGDGGGQRGGEIAVNDQRTAVNNGCAGGGLVRADEERAGANGGRTGISVVRQQRRDARAELGEARAVSDRARTGEGVAMSDAVVHEDGVGRDNRIDRHRAVERAVAESAVVEGCGIQIVELIWIAGRGAAGPVRRVLHIPDKGSAAGIDSADPGEVGGIAGDIECQRVGNHRAEMNGVGGAPCCSRGRWERAPCP